MKVLTVKDVCELLGVTSRTLRRYVKEGIIPARRLGGRVVFLEEELMEALKKLPTKRGA